MTSAEKMIVFLLTWFMIAFTCKCVGDISAARSQANIKTSLESIAESLEYQKYQ